jgi:hypothetical protein
MNAFTQIFTTDIREFVGSDRVARWHIFKPKSRFGLILKGLAKENVGVFYGHFVYITYVHLV